MVDDQVSAVTEALPTFPTHIGSHPSVGQLVPDQVGALPEALPTFLTLVGPFPGVDHPVADQTGADAEALPTFPTFVGPCPGVDPLVDSQVGADTEALPTLPTFIGTLPGVDGLVAEQIRGVSEAFPTLPTLVGPFPRVDHLVAEQAGPCEETPPTLQALVGLLPILELLMDHQLRALATSLAAFLAQGGSFLLRAPWAGFGAPPPEGSPRLFLPIGFLCRGAAQNGLFHQVLPQGFVLPGLHPQLLVWGRKDKERMGFASVPEGRGRRSPQCVPGRTASAAGLSCSRGPGWAGRWSRRERERGTDFLLTCLGVLGHLPLPHSLLLLHLAKVWE
uniref:Uncharacterized protein n=1 Tax=Cyanistes caeruleus TaxID=156563 RepID=A0A8C0U9Z7_CYACU